MTAAVIESASHFCGDLKLSFVSPDDVETFSTCWHSLGPTHEGFIAPALLPELIHSLPSPLGTKGGPFRNALRMSFRLRVTPTNRGMLRFENVLETLVWSDHHEWGGLRRKPRD
eukprot:729738-Prymnesium_polylepis.1